jgi:hypothetical protein
MVRKAGPELTPSASSFSSSKSSVLAAARRAGRLPSAATRASWAAGVFAAKATISISPSDAVRVYLRDDNRLLLQQFGDAVGFGNIRDVTRGGQPTGTYGWDSGDRLLLADLLYAFEPHLVGATHDKAAAALDLLRPGWRPEQVR